jgi:hypothetical protein
VACELLAADSLLGLNRATAPSLVVMVTRCIRSSSWRVVRQVSLVVFWMTRMSSRASQHSWM